MDLAQPEVRPQAGRQPEGPMTVPPPRTPVADAVPFTERLLSVEPRERGWVAEGRRLVVSLGLASLFGLAVGLRAGGTGIATHAAGVVFGITGVVGLAVPALAVVLALADAPLDGLGLARATSRATATAGLVLAGLAPGAALFAVTVEDAITVSIVTAGGLALAGAIAARTFVRAVAPELAPRRAAHAAIPVFVAFAALLAARLFWLGLPLLRAGVS
jgi:hypothetical protein